MKTIFNSIKNVLTTIKIYLSKEMSEAFHVRLIKTIILFLSGLISLLLFLIIVFWGINDLFSDSILNSIALGIEIILYPIITKIIYSSIKEEVKNK